MRNRTRIVAGLALCAALAMGGSPAEAARTEPWGAVWALPQGQHLLIVSESRGLKEALDRARGPLAPLEVFDVPPGVSLRTRLFLSRAEAEQHLLERYVAAVPVPTEIPTESGPQEPCTIPGSTSTGTGTGTGGTQFNGPPRIFILLPTSGPSFMPIAIGGTNFCPGSVPYVNDTPSISIFNWSVQNIPLVGSISVGFTIVPPAAPSGPGDVVLEYLGQRSNPFPFTVN